MKNVALLVVLLIVLAAVFSIFTWNIVQYNEERKASRSLYEQHDSEAEVNWERAKVEKYKTEGINKEDAQIIAPDGEIPIDELLEIVQ